MIKAPLIFTFIILLFTSCNTNVSNDYLSDIEVVSDSVLDVSILDTDTLVSCSLDQKEVIDDLVLKNGINIKWFKHGEGDKLRYGDCAMIDYKVFIDTTYIPVDGSHLLGKPGVPFLLGFNMQTPGWEIALKELRVGDFVEVFIPSELARGERGIKGLIPPNSDNIIRIRVLENLSPTREIEGNKVWLFEENERNKLKFKEGYRIKFHCMVSSPSNPFYINTYRLNNPFVLSLTDGGVVPGLKKALMNSKKSDRMFVYIPYSEAYGVKGYQDLVMSNEDLFYNIMVMDVFQ